MRVPGEALRRPLQSGSRGVARGFSPGSSRHDHQQPTNDAPLNQLEGESKEALDRQQANFEEALNVSIGGYADCPGSSGKTSEQLGLAILAILQDRREDLCGI